jgi:hypothetical protein
MSTLTNAAPKILFGGINDKSRGTLVRGEVTYAQHTPLLRLFCETGPETTTLISSESADFNSIFGSQTLVRRGKFFNLQSLAAEKLLQEGNPFFVKRLRPVDAGNSARLIVAIEMVADLIPKITTALSGFDYPNTVEGEDVTTTEGETVPGYRARIVLIRDNESEVGTQRVLPGTLLAESDGAQSMVYPLFELPASFFGEPGNNLGLRVWAPTLNDALPFDEATADAFLTRIYRFQFMKRSSASASPQVVKTVLGEDYVDASFMEGVYSESSEKEYYVGQVLTQSYEDDGLETGQAPVYSPFEQIHVYSANITTVQELLWAKETELNPAIANYITAPSQIDFLTATGVDGDPYQGILLEGALNGGIQLGKETTIYAAGGKDGTLSHAVYEELVNIENENFGDLGDDYANLAVYPFSVIYDTGLSMDGKFKMMNVLAKRKDIQARFTTYIEAEGRAPTKSEELSRAQALMTRLRAYPESLLHGTPVCRAEIIQQTGYLVGGGYTKPVPLLIDYLVRWARFAGAGTGILREGKDIDDSPNNRVTEVKNLNVKFLNDALATSSWSAGATFTQSYDTRSQYYPALHSVYNDDTSVLISPITVSIACDAMREVRKVHANLSGNAKLTNEQFIERSNKLINDLLKDKYGDRVTIIPETYFTADDKSNGFTWHCKLRILASNPRNVMYLDIETERRDGQA